MAWTSMHFAVGMGFAGAGTAALCMIRQRGWRWIPITMTVGGIWATLPDIPRLFREDFPSLGLGPILGSKQLEANLHAWGDVFFLHRQLDLQPREFALAGVILMILLYNAGLGLLMWLEHRQKRKAHNSSHLAALRALSQSQNKQRDHPYTVNPNEIVDFDTPKSVDHANSTDDPVVYRFSNTPPKKKSNRDIS